MTVTFSFSLETSSEPSSPQDHLYVIPTLSIVYSKATEISYDFDNCSAASKETTVWSLDPGDPSNVPSFTVKTYSDVREREVGI